jgi:hypothetical protein
LYGLHGRRVEVKVSAAMAGWTWVSHATASAIHVFTAHLPAVRERRTQTMTEATLRGVESAPPPNTDPADRAAHATAEKKMT